MAGLGGRRARWRGVGRGGGSRQRARKSGAVAGGAVRRSRGRRGAAVAAVAAVAGVAGVAHEGGGAARRT